MPPNSDGATQCDALETEWDISFTNWAYDKDDDLTYVRYEVCTSAVNPFNSCNPADDPVCIAGLFIQIPCLCEICLPEVTYHMQPSGKATIAFQGWIWFDEIKAGECEEIDIVLHGFADMNEGMYKIFGMDGRYQVGMIETPNPCYYYTSNPFRPDDSDSSSDSSDDSHDNYAPAPTDPDMGCTPRGLDFVEDKCDFLCQYDASEFSGTFVERRYDDTNNATTFVYEISADLTLNDCHPDEPPVALDEFYVRLGCDCDPLSETFLQSITKAMEPYGTVNENYWVWSNLELKPGDKLEVSITLEGEMEYSVGDLTFGGNSDNGYAFCTNDW
eukprot:CAMPEP_0201597134 /NCGR_PEP_ID=MMETSP0190_2-20130828/193697_1 /ASSEMBLY_ACC=CAM_ASM_000263 /TAXON_ID=37353 /ORGANISM="Rosalina sp." /LENGTH=329 /DNA_ID=CAMNT_0048057937 /DNA_START=1 /DNA_END=987 /DNA_ORIENTATION=-